MKIGVERDGAVQLDNSAAQAAPGLADFGDGPRLISPAAGFVVGSSMRGTDETVSIILLHREGPVGLSTLLDCAACLRVEQELREIREPIEATAAAQAAAALARAGAK